MAISSDRKLTWWQRVFGWIARSRFGAWIILHIATRFDPPLMRLTHGRLHFGRLVGIQVGLLTTRGAKTGLPRTVPLLTFMDGERFVMVASKVGSRHHPAWYHNLKANPHAQVTVNGRARRVIAEEASGMERERLWKMARDVYAGYETYQTRAGSRTIPVMALRPDDSEGG